MIMKENYQQKREELETLFKLFLVPRDIWFSSTEIVKNMKLLYDSCYSTFESKLQDSFVSLIILVEETYDVELSFDLLNVKGFYDIHS